MRANRTLLVALCLSLAACQTTASQPGTLVDTSPAPLCPAEIVAPSRAEPPMPAGVDLDGLYVLMVEHFGEKEAKAWWSWLTTSWRGWGQDGWKRVDKARASCDDLKPKG